MLKAILETPRRIMDAWLDPVRRRHSISRIMESYAPSMLVLTVLGVQWAFAWAAIIVLGEFLVFEWILEPLGLAGYYFERGPRDDEKFERP